MHLFSSVHVLCWQFKYQIVIRTVSFIGILFDDVRFYIPDIIQCRMTLIPKYQCLKYIFLAKLFCILFYFWMPFISGGNVVLLYASMYHDIPTVVNISGRYDLNRGIEDRLGKDFMQRIKKDGYIDVKDKTGNLVLGT